MGVGILGAVVLIAGIVAIPYPGPGWLIVFAGLGILATEFSWAQRLLGYARARYDAWTAWLRRQSLPVRFAVLAATALIVLTTLWLADALGLLTDLFGLDWAWIQSPVL